MICLSTLIAACLLLRVSVAPSMPTRQASASPPSTKAAPTGLGQLKPREIGPAITSGRIIALAVHPKDKSTWYAGAASGGVWKTTNNGTTFNPVFDSAGVYSIGAVAIDPVRPHVVWVGTGECNAQRSVGWGDGVYKSEDGGRTWRNMGLKSSEHIGRIVVDPNHPDTVWVAAQGPLWGPGGERGLYRTEDGGNSWRKVLDISENTGVTDVVLDPRDSKVVYAASWQRRRHVFTYVGGGVESGIHRSVDGGATWTKLRSGLPGGELGRIGLAIPPKRPDWVYATVEASNGGGTYRTADLGNTWEKRGDTVSQGMYYGQIVCDPVDPERVFILGVANQVSDDGGRTVAPLGERNKHVDNHALWIDPDDTRHILAGCDGGIYESFDRGATWVFKSNLPIAQFYRVAVDDAKPYYHVYGGTQDNNSLGGPSRSNNPRGVGSSEWFVLQGGDGFHQAVEPGNPDIVYTEYQDGGIARLDKRTGRRVGIQPIPGPGEPPYRFYWDSPLLVSPHNPKRIWFAGNIVFRSDDRGDSWTAASPDLTKRIDRNRLPVMGAAQRLDTLARGQSTSFYGNVISLDESPKVEGLLYAGTDDGLVQATQDSGKIWRRIDSFPGVPLGTYVGRILASKHSPDRVYALFDNHKNADFAPYALRSNDRGVTWESIVGTLPKNAPALSIAEDPVDPDILYIGTEFGLYVSVDKGAGWHKVPGLPPIPVRDLKVQAREDELVVGTFGRGIWIVSNLALLRGGDRWKEKAGAVLPIRDIVVRPNFDGTTGAEGETAWFAPNPPGGATFFAWVKDGHKTMAQKREEAEAEARRQGRDPGFPTAAQLRAETAEDPARLVATILDSSGNVVRRLISPLSSGLRALRWDLRHAGHSVGGGGDNRGGRSGGRGGGGTSGGVTPGRSALPGTYRIVLSKEVDGKESPLGDPESFRVVVDGEAELTPTERKSLDAARARVSKAQQTLGAAVEMLDRAIIRVVAIRVALDEDPMSTPALRADAARLAKELRQVDVALRGDDIASRLVEPIPWTTSRRIQDMAFNVLGTPIPPTKTRMDSLAVAEKELATVVPQLRKLVLDHLERLEKDLDIKGILHTPGRAPR